MKKLVREFKRKLVVDALAHTGGRRGEAAKYLMVSQSTMMRMIRDLGLREEFPPKIRPRSAEQLRRRRDALKRWGNE